jgi:hypothetical protein
MATIEPTDEPTNTEGLLALAMSGGDRNLTLVRDRIHDMTPEERRRLRLALDRLDDLLDAVVIERRLAKLKQQPQEG